MQHRQQIPQHTPLFFRVEKLLGFRVFVTPGVKGSNPVPSLSAKAGLALWLAWWLLFVSVLCFRLCAHHALCLCLSVVASHRFGCQYFTRARGCNLSRENAAAAAVSLGACVVSNACLAGSRCSRVLLSFQLLWPGAFIPGPLLLQALCHWWSHRCGDTQPGPIWPTCCHALGH